MPSKQVPRGQTITLLCQDCDEPFLARSSQPSRTAKYCPTCRGKHQNRNNAPVNTDLDITKEIVRASKILQTSWKNGTADKISGLALERIDTTGYVALPDIQRSNNRVRTYEK